MDQAKIRLSPEETDLITRPDWILTKNRIMGKAGQLLAGLQEAQSLLFKQEKGLNEIPVSTAKISKGENYRGLPYLVLDHPRIFEKNDVFAIRTFFWWGHFFSTTLQLSGTYLHTHRNSITRGYDRLKQDGFFVCISESPWEHHFEAHNYKAIDQITEPEFRTLVHERPFIKLSKKILLTEWNDAPGKLLEMFSQLLAVLRR